MHCALSLKASLWSSSISIPEQLSMFITHGALLIPQSTFGVNTVRVTSWSTNCPQVIVIWVKSGGPPLFVVVFSNTVFDTFLVFGRGTSEPSGGLSAERRRGRKPGCSYSVGGSRPGKRWCGWPAAPLVVLQRLLHVPSNVRYRLWEHAKRTLMGETQFSKLSVSRTCWAYATDNCEEAGRTSYTAIISKIPRRNL